MISRRDNNIKDDMEMNADDRDEEEDQAQGGYIDTYIWLLRGRGGRRKQYLNKILIKIIFCT